MNNNEIITHANLMIRIAAADKDELFRKMAKKAAELPPVKQGGITDQTIFEALRKREEQFSTALGRGVIFPHARFSALHSHAVIVVATLSGTLKCETPDNTPVRIACLLLIPEEQPMQGLKFISAFAKCLRDSAFSETLLNAKEKAEAVDILQKIRLDEPETLRASDLMVPPRCNVTPEMPLKDATRMMAKFHAETVPVLNGRRLVGQLSCVELFKLGIPDFFSQLKSVGFIRYFDPFENYFAVEAGSLVKDVMNTNCKTFSPDTTLIEIVFAISVQHYPLVYIVNSNNDLLGVIDQTLLLERIINL